MANTLPPRVNEPLRIMYVTCPDMETALKIGRQMVTERRAACANILPQMVSVYEWKGEIHEDPEVVLLLKTNLHQVEELILRVRELHPYDLPAIFTLEIAEGLPEYLRWIAQSVNP